MSSLKFGTSGLRGLVVDLLGWPSYAHALAFLRSAGKGKVVLIGRDLRASSPEIAATVAAAARNAGVQALDCGALPTPALALEALRLDASAIMVTGSHIPEDRNGLKFYTRRGEITKTDEALILAALPQQDAAVLSAEAELHPEALARYAERYVAGFGPGALGGLSTGVYQQSSVARDLLVEVLTGLGAKVTAFGRADHFIPVDTEAHRPEDLAVLRDAAGAGAFDAIVTTDGDGDRPLITDATGTVLRGDVVGVIASQYLGVKVVAVPVSAASGIEPRGGFAATIRTRVGSPFVIEGMERARRNGQGPIAGFEANGGFLLGSNVSVGDRTIAALATRDALLPIVATLAAAKNAGAPLAKIVSELGMGAAASDRLKDVAAERSGPFLRRLADADFRAAFLAPVGQVVAVDDLDGVRMQLNNGCTVHFRVSGNAPELRCYAEADSAEDAEKLVAWGLAAADSSMNSA